MADCAVDLKKGTCLTLVVENRRYEAVRLKKGIVLGDVSPVAEVTGSEMRDVPKLVLGEESHVSALQVDSMDRVTTLMSQLELDLGHLTTEEQQQLTDLITSYADIFALDSSELGTTEAVYHSINTGDHPPIRQPLWRTPFAL